MRSNHAVRRFLRPLDEAPVQAYVTDLLQTTDIIEWVIGQIGESDILQTTFSISEEYLRRLFAIRENGLIRSLDLILDFKATNKTVDLWIFLERVADRAYLADNHSKVILFRSTSGRSVAVITSQNLTRGNRNESAVVIESADIYDTVYNQIQDIIKSKSIPLNEILSGSD